MKPSKYHEEFLQEDETRKRAEYREVWTADREIIQVPVTDLNPTAGVKSTYSYAHGEGIPGRVEVQIYMSTYRAAFELASQFPAGAGAKVTRIGGSRGDYTCVFVCADLYADDVNKGINETGIRRYRAFRKACDKLGIPVEWDPYHGCANAYRDEASFEAGLANAEEVLS